MRRTLSSGHTITERESCPTCHGTGQRMCNYCSGPGDQRKYRTAQPEVAMDAADFEANESDDDAVTLEQNYSDLYKTTLAEAVKTRGDAV